MSMKIALIAGLGSILALELGPMIEKGPRDVEVSGACHPFTAPDGLKDGYIGDNPQLLSSQSVWEFRLRNCSPKDLTNLRFKLPFNGYYFVRDGDSGRQGNIAKFTGGLSLERLAPGQYLVLTLWTDAKEDRKLEERVRVASDQGGIAVEYPVAPSGILAWLERNKVLIGFSLVVLVLMVVL